MKRTVWTILVTAMCQTAAAQDSILGNEQKYSIFRPVPKEKMREMQTDRPDATESPYTVDAGHFQYETDLFKTVRTRENGILTTKNFYNAANLKLGITSTTDLQLVVESLVKNRTKSTSSTGFGDITVRLKQNLWGNNEGKTALGLLPYISFPTSKDAGTNKVSGGIVFPLAVELNKNWGMGTQIGIDLVADQGTYQKEMLYSFTFGRGLGSRADAYAESCFTYNLNSKVFQTSLSSGIVVPLSPNFKLDAGLSYGLTKETDKIYFTGFSFRY